MYFRDDDVLQMFRELPGHRGNTKQELDDVQAQLGVSFPSVYRDMMRLDAARLVSAGIVFPIHKLKSWRDEADEQLLEDGYCFRFCPHDVVFAWEETFAFIFFRAVGDIDTPVMKFNYYNSDDDWEPQIAFDTLTNFFAAHLRRYLNLP